MNIKISTAHNILGRVEKKEIVLACLTKNIVLGSLEHPKTVWNFCFSSTDRRLASVCGELRFPHSVVTCIVWNIATGQRICVCNMSLSTIQSISFQDEFVAICGASSIVLWNTTLNTIATIHNGTTVCYLYASLSSKYLATSITTNGKLKCFNLRYNSWQEVQCNLLVLPCLCAKFSPDSLKLAILADCSPSCGQYSSILLSRDLVSDQLYVIETNSRITCFNFSANSRYLLCGSYDATIELYCAETRKCLKRMSVSNAFSQGEGMYFYCIENEEELHLYPHSDRIACITPSKRCVKIDMLDRRSVTRIALMLFKANISLYMLHNICNFINACKTNSSLEFESEFHRYKKIQLLEQIKKLYEQQ